MVFSKGAFATRRDAIGMCVEGARGGNLHSEKRASIATDEVPPIGKYAIVSVPNKKEDSSEDR